MNVDLLINLYKIHAPSGGEKKMRDFIKRYVRENIPDAKVVAKDKNLYVTRGVSDTYPCVVAHLDQVQRSHDKDFDCIIHGDIILGFSESAMQQQGLGADDKNGIWVALECLRKYDVIKCAFFWGEEIGCQGSERADLQFFNDVRYCIQCDRRNGDDMITYISSQIASDDFVKDCGYADFGYHVTSGAMTDVDTLSDLGIGVSCVNLSCGYYYPHTNYEVTRLHELDNCLRFVEHIIETCTDVYPMENCYHDSGFGFWDPFEDGTYSEMFDCIDTILTEYPDFSVQDIINNFGSALPCKDIDFVSSVYDGVKNYYSSFTTVDELVS